MPILRVTIAVGFFAFLCACAGPNAAIKPDSSMNKNAACLTATGSRISTEAGCAAFGRSYSSGDIDRTGATTAGGSLRLLDPSLTVH